MRKRAERGRAWGLRRSDWLVASCASWILLQKDVAGTVRGGSDRESGQRLRQRCRRSFLHLKGRGETGPSRSRQTDRAATGGNRPILSQ
ncbi:unnamed protein product, partial [Mycena citricolor]